MTVCEYTCLKPDGAQCELAKGHKGPHRNGLLIWHDPPVIFVGGKPYSPEKAKTKPKSQRAKTKAKA